MLFFLLDWSCDPSLQTLSFLDKKVCLTILSLLDSPLSPCQWLELCQKRCLELTERVIQIIFIVVSNFNKVVVLLFLSVCDFLFSSVNLWHFMMLWCYMNYKLSLLPWNDFFLSLNRISKQCKSFVSNRSVWRNRVHGYSYCMRHSSTSWKWFSLSLPWNNLVICLKIDHQIPFLWHIFIRNNKMSNFILTVYHFGYYISNFLFVVFLFYHKINIVINQNSLTSGPNMLLVSVLLF